MTIPNRLENDPQIPPLALPPQQVLVNPGQMPIPPQLNFLAPGPLNILPLGAVNALALLQQGNQPLPALVNATRAIGLHHLKSRFGG